MDKIRFFFIALLGMGAAHLSVSFQNWRID